MIGALSQVSDLPITTAATCPTGRIHPMIIAQAAATSAVMTNGKFILGLGSGEALNESIAGKVWPPTDIRLEMLAEAIQLIRELWSGDVVTHSGKHFTTHHARIYTLPQQPPKIFVSGFGPKSTRLAARMGDGYISTRPDEKLVKLFQESGGGGKPITGGAKACYAKDEDEAVKMAYERWRSSALPGELAQVLPTPQHFEQASKVVEPQAMRKEMVCGPDPAKHLEGLKKYRDAGFDEVYVAPVGRYDLDMIDFYASEIIPALAD